MNFGNKKLYRCYIDESGDEGLSPSSRPFFFVTAVVFDDAYRLPLHDTLDLIKKRAFPLNTNPPSHLHWNRLKHPHRVISVREIAKQPITVISVGIWKPRLRVLKHRMDIYHTAIHYLIQRVSWFVGNSGGYAKITFADRSNLDIQTIRKLLTTQLTTPGSQMRRIFEPSKIEVAKPAVQQMLQVADTCAGAVANAFNQDQYGENHPTYLYDLCHRLYRSNGGKLAGYGIKIFPDKDFLDCRGSNFGFLDVVEHIITTGERIPGSSLLPHR